MDAISPIFTITKEVFCCAAERVSLISELREDLESLEEEMEILIFRSQDLERRVEAARQRQMTPRREVEGWLRGVQEEKAEVTVIQQEGNALLEQKCLGRFWNILSMYRLGKRVNRKIIQLRELRWRGDFEGVSYWAPRAVLDELPLGETVGLDSLHEEVCSCLADHEVRLVGLYGEPEIGKTTLMKKIHNGLLGTNHQFDTVIWVSVSRKAPEQAAQQVIGNKLGIIDNIWPNRSPPEKAIQIFNFMKTKRFLLFLDEGSALDLSQIGVPFPGTRNRSKVIITNRVPQTCIRTKSERWFEVKPLATEYAWSLFSNQLQEEARTLAQHDPEIQDLAYSILDRCKGIPSVIIEAGQAVAFYHTPRQWRQSKERVEHMVNSLISLKQHMKDEPLAGAEMPLGHTVGFDLLCEKVYDCINKSQGGLIGLYGKGGVGKTTLMKKIYNKCLQASNRLTTVIWVAMSKQENIKAAQEVIRNKFQIPDSIWQSRSVDERAREIFKIMKKRSFLLFIDDVWEGINLQEIGVPPIQERGQTSKVIITTRFQNICNDMEVPVRRQFRVEVLARKEALTLFLEKVGENSLSSHPDIPQLAEKVAEQCKGLPLALVTIARAMANKNSPEAWEQAIQELGKSPANFSGMEDGLFHVLKLSYDRLRDDATKSCFRYYSCFPKGYEFKNDELIEHWIGEGFVDGQDIDEKRMEGQKIIDNLRNACLLEEGDGFKECIKMHDVIHEMALWISQECGKKMKENLVYESFGFADAERGTNWNEAKILSLWGKKIEKLPTTPHCSNLQTLFVRECIQLKLFPREFFQFMPLLKVLDLSATPVLADLPYGIERLINLEYINLSMTQIKELPIGIMKLKRLRCFILNGMLPLIIPPHVISSLLSLQLFSMYDGNALSVHRASLLEELESIESLSEICLSFRSAVALNKLLTSHKLQSCIRRLSIYECQDLELFVLSPIFLNQLETLEIFNCLQLQEMKINVEKEGSKDSKEIYDIPNPNLTVRSNQHFHRLRDVKIWSCPKLLNLTWLIYARHLQSLNVQFCQSMKEVISCQYVASGTQHLSVFTRLKSVVLGAMPVLESIYHGALLFPSLEVISVINCPLLGRLPFDSNTATKNLTKIEGDGTWWERLEWGDKSVKDIFIYYFSPQYLADPIHSSGEMKGKKNLVVECSTSTTISE